MSIIPSFFLDTVVSINTISLNEQGIHQTYCIGSGFLVSKMLAEGKGYVNLITNKHVIRNQKIVHLRFNSLDEKSSKDYELNLYDQNGKQLFSEHPNPNIDIVAININTDLLIAEEKNFASFEIGRHTLTIKDMKNTGVDEGALVYALGFPMNLQDWIKTPISRLGSISKIRHLFRDVENLYYIVDAQVFPGNSGGPVISRPEVLSIEGTKNNDNANLIGIVCSYIPYVEQAISLQTGKIRSTFEENSGLTNVHPVDFIIDAIEAEINRINNSV